MGFLRRLFHWRWFRRHDDSLAAEMEHHRALVQADLEADGLSRVEAEAASRRAMGNITLAREDAREVWIAAWVDRVWRDVKYGVRGLLREPAFALISTLTLALGVTTTTIVFSVVDSELWKPLRLPEPDRLVAVFSRAPGERRPTEMISGVELLEWRAGTPALSAVASVGVRSRRILQLDAAESVTVTEVTANYFATLGRPAVAGRTFTDDDARGSQAAVLTDRAVRRLFDADPSIVGRTLTLDDQTVVVVGVVAVDESLGANPDVFLASDEGTSAFLDPGSARFYSAIGRLQPDAEADVARQQLQAVVARLESMEADSGRQGGSTIEVESLQESSTGYNWRPLYFFLGASLVVLLLSAVNVAALLLGRAFRRTREFALRGALGGGQGALARQLLVEGALVAIPGGAIAVLLTAWALRVFAAELPADVLVRGASIPVDLRVAAFAMVVTTITTVLCVLSPILVARRIDSSGALGPGGRVGRSRVEGRARMALLVAQMALTLVLLSGAGIFLKSFIGLTSIPLGFEPADVVAMRTSLSGPRYADDAQVQAYGERLLGQVRAIPGIDEVSIGSSSPLGSGPMVNFARPDDPPLELGDRPRAIIRGVTPAYFRTLGMPIVRGRELMDTDVAGGPRVALVNQTLARETFGDESPIGRVIELLPGARAPWTRQPGPVVIVGVVSNVKEVGLNEVDFSDIYVPFVQMPTASFELLARTNVPAAGLGDALRQAAAEVDPSSPVISLSTFEQRVANVLQQDRFNLVLISAFAGVALLLAAIGIYGAVAYAVQARTRELGVRLALGASPLRLVGLALWQAGRPAVIGGACGLVGTLVIARVLGSALYLVPGSHNGLLYGVSTTDPWMLAGAFAGIVAVALVAGAVPARRVARVNPVLALRNE